MITLLAMHLTFTLFGAIAIAKKFLLHIINHSPFLKFTFMITLFLISVKHLKIPHNQMIYNSSVYKVFLLISNYL
ncbi:hypothetical protein CBU01nite_11380 [Clostridium butyricum]|nr:hypothetical protein CBU01nite_11380 [Clostridium butyricum]